MRRALVVVLLAIAGCRADEVSQADRQIVCSLDGKAFYVKPGAGDISFVTRTPTADALCKGRGQ